MKSCYLRIGLRVSIRTTIKSTQNLYYQLKLSIMPTISKHDAFIGKETLIRTASIIN